MMEVLCPTRTDCGLSVRKSSSPFHRGLLKPGGHSLSTKCCGMMVLKAELKSRNSSHTGVFFSSRCARLKCRAEEMASLVQRLGW